MSEKEYLGISVVSTVRDVAKNLRKNVLQLRNSLGFFSQQVWIVAESDSSDNTLEELERLSIEFNDFRYLTLGNLQSSIPERTIRIAKSRNRAFELMSSYPENDYPYVLLADLDGRNIDISQSAIKSCFALSSWDMCAANQLGPYYDIWGLRHEIWSPNDCWNSYRELKDVLGELNARKVLISSKMIHLEPNQAPIRVQSAFGGLALYRRSVLKGQYYSETLVDGQEVCDHVDLNVRLSTLGYRLLINPKMINKVTFPNLRTFFSSPRITLIWFARAISYKVQIFFSRQKTTC